MVEQQVRTWEVLDQRVLDALVRVRREDFVPQRHRKLAFTDMMLPLDEGQVMMKPVVEGRMLQALSVEPFERALEIGTGSGFITACLADLAREVASLDIHPKLAGAARARVSAAGYSNFDVIAEDALGGWQPPQAYDALAVTGSVPSLPETLKSWVDVGGRIFVVEGQSPVMEAVLYTQVAEGDWQRESLFETDLPRLENIEEPSTFVL